MNRDNAISVLRANNTQYVNGYDAHGRYFNTFIQKFKNFGIIVKIKYDANDRKLMKKINEKNKSKSILTKNGKNIDMSMFHTPILNETEDDPEYKAKVEALYNGLKNCNKDFGYIDKDHWYISIA